MTTRAVHSEASASSQGEAVAAAASSSTSSSSECSGPLRVPQLNSPFFTPLPHSSWSPTAACNALGREISSMNAMIHADLQGLSSIPRIYAALFQRTRNFAVTVRQLAKVSPNMWAQAACMLIDWGVHILRHPAIRLERFLNSQRESLYWILDDAMMRICIDEWDPPRTRPLQTVTCNSPSCPSCSPSSSSPATRPAPPCSTLTARTVVPWDVVTEPLRRSLTEAQSLIPLWGQKDVEETKKWNVPACEGAMPEWFEVGWFRKSTTFLTQSTRLYELWRTMRRVAKGQLPAELANAIVEDVAEFEQLPMGSLRELYFSSGKWR